VNPACPGGGDQGVSWRRLSARMLLLSPVRELAGAIPALVGVIVAGRAVGGGHSWWVGPLGAFFIVCLSVLRWMSTRYRITPEQVQLRTGLLRRKTIATPADRVRSVDVTASALHRILGLAKVDIGTGSRDAGSGLSLDSLTVAEAAGLRAELLHRSSVANPETVASRDSVAQDDAVAQDRSVAQDGWLGRGEQETELVRLDPRWVRFAPFTLSGVLGAAAILGLGSRLLDQLDINAKDIGPIRATLTYVEGNSIWLDVMEGLVGLALLVTALSIGGYVLAYWGFRLTRHPRGTLQVTRGLLTTRATSLEERRMRGIELAEPLLLRSVGGARLAGITTGLASGGGRGGVSSLLLPPAPRAVAATVAARILKEEAPLTAALTPHGPAARQRRYVRALLAAFVLVVVSAVAISTGASRWLALPALASLPLAILLGADRYRSLGHALAGRHLVTRAGTFVRRRDALACDGIIGWNVRQTYFQRRSGLVTLAATTAAGRQRYALTDVPLPMALSLATASLPGLLEDFLARADKDPALLGPTHS
jgi:putative membrane protein